MIGGNNIPIPAGTPDWAVALVRNIEKAIQQSKRGPQSLSTYANNAPPIAGVPKRAIAFDETNNVPWFANKSGTWTDLIYQGGPATITLLTLAPTVTAVLTTSVSLVNHNGSLTATLLNAPVAGDPTKWITINDNGTERRIPTW